MELPVIGFIDDIIKGAFKSVFDDLNKSTDDYIRSLDLFKKGRTRYFDFINDRYGNVQILGMTRPSALADIFVSVKVNYQIDTKRYLNVDYASENEVAYLKKIEKEKNASSEDPIEAISKLSRVTVLGKPGCGKTTLLKYFALLYSGQVVYRSKSFHSNSTFFPIIVVLREYQETDITILEYITRALNNCGFPDADLFLDNLLASGKAFVMLDGLDEVDDINTAEIHKQVFDLLAKHPKNKYLISCRTAAYKDNYEGFTEIEIEDFTPVQQYKFVEAWFTREQKKGSQLIGYLKSIPQVSELSKNPLLLSLVCILYQRTLDIPRNRVELYEECMRTMLREWDATRNFRRKSKYESLSDLRKIKLFNFLAYSFLARGQRIFHRKSLVTEIASYIPRYGIGSDEGEEILCEIESHHGIIVPISSSDYCFSHLTFQEYCTASYLVDTRQEKWLLKHILDPRWIEVFNIVTSLLEDATSFLSNLLELKTDNEFYQLCLAAYCISNDASISEELKRKITTSLLDEIAGAGDLIKNIYVTHKTKRVIQKGLFVKIELSEKRNPTLGEKKKVYRFMSAINGLYSVFHAAFIRELTVYFEDASYSKYKKIFTHILLCKEENESFILYSNILNEGGVNLPLNVTNFESRIKNHLKKKWK